MDDIKRRNIYPVINWQRFLEEAKKEFESLYEVEGTSGFGKENLVFIKVIGKGNFGIVLLAKSDKLKEKYAIKVVNKNFVVKKKQTSHSRNEKRIMQALNFPFCMPLMYFFMDNTYLYFVMPYVPGGTLFKHLRSHRRFDEPVSKFYGAQMLLALEYLHFINIIFRDLKPENILMDERGYLRLTDYGFSKVLTGGRTYTQCGTPEYQAPEIIMSLHQAGYNKAVDWWAFGILLYEMTNGETPFFSDTTMKIYGKIVDGSYQNPLIFSSELTDLVDKLLQVNPTKRIGSMKNGINDIKYHRWFRGIDFVALLHRNIKPPDLYIIFPDEYPDTPEKMPLQVGSVDEYKKDFCNFYHTLIISYRYLMKESCMFSRKPHIKANVFGS